MEMTHASLLERLRSPGDAQAWRRWLDLYTPLIRGWLGRHGLQPADVDDVSQQILAVVVRDLPEFHHNGRPGAFRSWLRALTVNRLREHWRAQRRADGGEALLDQLADPASDLSRQWDAEHDLYVVRHLLELLEPEFTPRTWALFRRSVLDGLSAEAVAAEQQATPNAVWIAKSRVMARLRQEAQGLVDGT
jgi:RNA polymerase sigma-70 factor (ECF subfamily)